MSNEAKWNLKPWPRYIRDQSNTLDIPNYDDAFTDSQTNRRRLDITAKSLHNDTNVNVFEIMKTKHSDQLKHGSNKMMACLDPRKECNIVAKCKVANLNDGLCTAILNEFIDDSNKTYIKETIPFKYMNNLTCAVRKRLNNEIEMDHCITVLPNELPNNASKRKRTERCCFSSYPKQQSNNNKSTQLSHKFI